MKSLGMLLFVLLSSLGGIDWLTRIHDRNQAVQQARTAYTHGNFAEAAHQYQQAVETYGATEEAIVLNLAHACWRAGQASNARAYYGRLLTSPTATVRSVAQQQLALLASQRGEYAQAIGLLRQALLANPSNQAARYNYELLRDYLVRHRESPGIPPPSAPTPKAARKKPADSQNQANQPQPRAGTGQPGQLDNPAQPQDARNLPQPRPNQQGQRDNTRPGDAPGTAAEGSFRPGSGPQRNIARGSEPGTVRGLSDSNQGPAAPTGRGRRAGTDLAPPDAAQLQTQRARLEQMNLSPERARQLLDALSSAEQQYLQQVPHKAAPKAASGKPAW